MVVFKNIIDLIGYDGHVYNFGKLVRGQAKGQDFLQSLQ